MIFFHGTSENFLKDIKKNGLRNITSDQWLMEITGEKFCCISSKPNAGEGGSPSYFAVRGARERNSNGYLVVVDIDENSKNILAICDNRILDDYVRFHFFVREEFRQIGFNLYSLYKEKKERFELKINKRKAKNSDHIIYAPSDQRGYYKELRKDEHRYVYDISGIKVSDDFYDFMIHIGIGKPLYYFLEFHFGHIDKKKYDEHNKNDTSHEDFWRGFYRKFPLTIKENKWLYIQNWFSPKWLEDRKLEKVIRNSQSLVKSVSAENILGFIEIATPSGFIKKFRPSKAKGASFSQMVWKDVLQMQANNK